MAHIVFAWELGGGLGHAGSIKPLAQEARRRGHQVSLCLRDLVHTDVILRNIDAPRFQAPVWLHQVNGVPSPPANMAEILMSCGYLNADALRGLLTGWRSLLTSLKADLLVADYSPTAVLAARSLNIPSATTGLGFFIPPDATPLPRIRDWEPVQAGRLEHAETTVLNAINTVFHEMESPPLQRLSQALMGDTPLLLCWPELDPYGREALPAGQRWWGPSMLQAGGEPPTWAQGNGAKVFAYLKSGHPDHELVLKALVKLGCRTVCYLPEVAAGRPPPVTSPLIHYCATHADLALTLPGCDLCICHAGSATVAQALLLGVPTLLLPTQTEQFLVARRVGKIGMGINAAERVRPLDYAALIASMLGETSYLHAARDFAARYAGFTPARHTPDLVDEFERLLQM
jgi:UDP:flavonoid glycosyltransferase YjiC (YdhE family)